jgi:hypothetical protein
MYVSMSVTRKPLKNPSANYCKQSNFFKFTVSYRVVFLKSIQDTNPNQTQQLYYTVTFNAIRFSYIESSTDLLENRSNVSTFLVHCGITKYYNRWYSQYKSTAVRDMIIRAVVFKI